jgi:alpha-1,3-glucan synthase
MGVVTGPGHSRERFDDDAISTSPEDVTREPSLYMADDGSGARSRVSTKLQLRLEDILSSQESSQLSKVEPGFTDPTGLYYYRFEDQLRGLTGKNSDTALCVEKFLVNSEKDWYQRFYKAKMGAYVHLRSVSGATTPSEETPAASIQESENIAEEHYSLAQFAMPENYQHPKGVRKLMKVLVFEWPVYAYILAFGQILAANSYQIVLLTGEVGTTATKVYIIAGVYACSSILWWTCFRSLQSRYVLTLPWALYGLAFLMIGVGPWSDASRGHLQLAAASFYSAASASGGLFFSLNFGSEGSATVKSWGYRALWIQGIQQSYIAALWFWGSRANQATVSGFSWTHTRFFNGYSMTVLTVLVAMLLWFIGTVLYIGLPDYYRQAPEKIPSFYRSSLGRRVVLWFLFAICLQNLFMSAQTGRNWSYLWNSKHAPAWTIAALLVIFFIGIWALALKILANASATHPWTLPIFAVGVGAPRWAQILWSTSGMGAWMPWAGGSYVASALVGRILWLWLGVLDSVQGVGFGMILLQTLTRIHMSFTLMTAQVLGAVMTIIARRFIAHDGGPGLVFPNFLIGRWTDGNALGDWGQGYGLGSAWFWAGLLSQIAVCVGFLLFYRKEQLQKP